MRTKSVGGPCPRASMELSTAGLRQHSVWKDLSHQVKLVSKRQTPHCAQKGKNDWWDDIKLPVLLVNILKMCRNALAEGLGDQGSKQQIDVYDQMLAVCPEVPLLGDPLLHVAT